jgi:predicted porin
MAGGALPHGAYMLTVANKSLKQVPITLSYYSLPDLAGGEEGSALWADVQVDAGIPVKFGLQGGQIAPENNMEDTTAFGAKINGKAGPAALTLAYSSVDDGTLGVKNVGTNVKTPLYTQMILNQNHIARDADTILVKGVVPVGPGKIIAQFGATTDNSDDGTDYQELDFIYKFKALGADMLAAYVMSDHDVDGQDPNNIIRVWTRYNF